MIAILTEQAGESLMKPDADPSEHSTLSRKDTTPTEDDLLPPSPSPKNLWAPSSTRDPGWSQTQGVMHTRQELYQLSITIPKSVGCIFLKVQLRRQHVLLNT